MFESTYENWSVSTNDLSLSCLFLVFVLLKIFEKYYIKNNKILNIINFNLRFFLQISILPWVAVKAISAWNSSFFRYIGNSLFKFSSSKILKRVTKWLVLGQSARCLAAAGWKEQREIEIYAKSLKNKYIRTVIIYGKLNKMVFTETTRLKYLVFIIKNLIDFHTNVQ